MIQARQCARDRQHTTVDTSHLLVGMLRVEGCLGQRVLSGLGLTRDAAENALALLHLRRYYDSADPIPTSGPLRAALTFAVEEAQALGHSYIGTEHLLLGLARSGSGAAQDILEANDLTADQLRREVMKILQEGETEIALERALRTARLSAILQAVISRAAVIAAEMNQTEPTLLHVLMALAQDTRSLAGQLLRACGLDEDRLAWDAATGVSDAGSGALEDVLDDAVLAAEQLGDSHVGTDHIVHVLARGRLGARTLARYGVDLALLQRRCKALPHDQ
jgi:ATP-dependent Clp protease ATP-binding subunit ClpA